jgi:peptidoglycan biosynthesis protein MviN/MurJ (putative lipid II flippase)
MGRLRWFACLSLAEALANLVLSVALVVPLGVEGVALGTAIPSAVASVALAVYVCRKLGVGVGEYVRRSCVLPVIFAGGLAAAWGIAVTWIPPVSWGALLTIGTVGSACFLTAALLVECGPQAVLRRLKAAVRKSAGEPGPEFGHGPEARSRSDRSDPARAFGPKKHAA